MRTMNETRLGQEGIEYVRSCLRQGSDLCTKLLELTLVDGEAFAPVPDDISFKRLTQFSVGGILSRKEMVEWLTYHLKSLFHSSSIGTFVLQDVWARPEDAAGTTTETKKFFHKENVYYFLGHDDLKTQHIAEALRELRSYLIIAVFARLQISSYRVVPGGQVNDGLITDLAKATREVFVSAYDQEGLVVWRKSIE
jgi:hypothetical protein